MSKNPVVTVMPAALQTTEQFGEFILQKLFQLGFRAAIVWGFLALFFPQLGVTFWLVVAGLVALRMVRGHDNQILINSILRKSK